MKTDRTELSKAVRTALSALAVAGAGVGVTGAAFAQDANTDQSSTPKTLKTVMVTGSHVRRVDLETDNPVTVVTAQQIAATGALTVGDVVRQLPAVAGGIKRPTVNNEGAGNETEVGLRGLGPSRTLVLIDGQRVGIANGNSGVDLNLIPANAIERVEVLKSGASAIYGSDAIGGVMNFILKSNYQGTEFTTHYGVSRHGDGTEKGASFLFGETGDKGSIVAGVDYNHFDGVLMGARDFSRGALSLVKTANGGVGSAINGSSYAERGFVSLGKWQAGIPGLASCPGGSYSLNADKFTASTSPTTVGDYHCYSQADGYDYASINYLFTPSQRTNAFVNGLFHLSEHIDFHATVIHNQTTGQAQAAPGTLGTDGFDGELISNDSYYNPFGTGPNGMGTEPVFFSSNNGAVYRLRTVPMGNRNYNSSRSTDWVSTSLNGHFSVMDHDWTATLGYVFSRSAQTATGAGNPDQSKLAPGLGPSFKNSDGVIQCGTPSEPIPLASCTPWDPFNINAPSSVAVLQGARSTTLDNLWSNERYWHADVSGGIIDLPAGTAQLALGAQYRKEYLNNTIDTQTVINETTLTCPLGTNCTAHLQGGYNVKEAYAELFIPLLEGMRFARGLNVTLGDRFSKYSTFGSTNNWKVGIEYRPVDDLLMRGTVSSVFRAPTIGDVFAPPTSKDDLLSRDPCEYAGSGANPNAGSPACLGVPATGPFINREVQNNQQIRGVKSGSSFAHFGLGPEVGKSFDYGVVYSPHFVPGLSLAVDYWRIYLENTIQTVGGQTVMDLCFAGQTRYCSLIQRQQSGPNAGQMLNLLLPTGNLGRIDVKGVDLQATYRLPELPIGQFNVSLDASYLTQYKIQTAPGAPGSTVLEGAGVMGHNGSALQASCPFSSGAICFFPRVQGQGTVGWRLGSWNAQWTLHYIDAFKMAQTFAPNLGRLRGIDLYGSYVYSDVMVGYDIEPLRTSISFGVRNAFDKQPPLMFANRARNSNTDPNDFDVLGRYYWGRVTVKF